MVRAGTFRCRMSKEFVAILTLYSILHIAREIKPLVEEQTTKRIRTAIKTLSISAIDLSMYFLVFEIKLFQEKLSS